MGLTVNLASAGGDIEFTLISDWSVALIVKLLVAYIAITTFERLIMYGTEKEGADAILFTRAYETYHGRSISTGKAGFPGIPGTCHLLSSNLSLADLQSLVLIPCLLIVAYTDLPRLFVSSDTLNAWGFVRELHSFNVLVMLEIHHGTDATVSALAWFSLAFLSDLMVKIPFQSRFQTLLYKVLSVACLMAYTVFLAESVYSLFSTFTFSGFLSSLVLFVGTFFQLSLADHTFNEPNPYQGEVQHKFQQYLDLEARLAQRFLDTQFR